MSQKVDLLEAALAHALAGRAIFPCHNGGKKNKQPMTEHGVLDATTDPVQITKWWTKWPSAHIAMACGAASGIIVVDIDEHDGSLSGFDHLPEWLNIISDAAVKTPSGRGLHLWYKYRDGVVNYDPHPGIEIRSNGRYVIIPPSMGYKWMTGKAPRVIPDTPEQAVREKTVINGEAPAFLHAYNTGLGNSEKEEDTFAPPTEATVRAALDALDPDMDYHQWVRVAGACKDYPAELFIEWSSNGKKYEGPRVTKAKFESCKSMTQVTIASLFHMANEADPDWREDIEEKEPEPATVHAAEEAEDDLLQDGSQFSDGYVSPSYLLDGVVLMSYLYALTAPTGQGKTSIALFIALMVALGRDVCGHEVKQGKVLYFAGENDVDIRARWIKLCEDNGVPPCKDVVFMPSLQKLSCKKFQKRLIRNAAKHGTFCLLVVDTSAAYSEMEDENANMQILEHARAMRKLIKDIPGKPTVLVLCHPVKTPNMDSLLPRGGGAFLAEIDGNLICRMVPGTNVVDLHTHGKFRGTEFDPLSFELQGNVTSERLIDEKGRMIPTVVARALGDAEREAKTVKSGDNQDALLNLMLTSPGLSLSAMAEKLGWFDSKGDPYKTLVQRLLDKSLKPRGLVDKDRADKWQLTDKGKKAAAQPSSSAPDGEDVQTPQGKFKSM